MEKIIFVGGKGGVGKTTCASTLAYKYSKENKVLLVSTDPAHSTGDLFDVKLDKKQEKFKYSENLDILEIDGEKEAELYLSNIKKQCNVMLSPIIMDEIKGQLNNAKNSPGTHESAVFDKINKIILENKDYDYIIFDTAPTGHTLRLIKLPKTINIWMDTLIKKRKKILMLKNMKFGRKDRIADDEVLKLLENRRETLGKIHKFFSDPNKVSFYFVMNPDKLSFLETKRGVETLDNFGVKINKIIVNKLYPHSIDPFWQEQKEKQEKFIDLIIKGFQEKDVVIIPFLKNENIEMLKEIGELIV